MSSDYKYYRLEDLYCIHIGNGRSAWQKWGVMDHEGPIIRLDYLGYPQKHYAYLPLSLLTALYQRFAQSSQSELRLGDFDDMDDIAIERYGDEQSTLLYDERKILATINHEWGDEGYPLLTPYLPELLDPDIINRIAADPWLDRRLLAEAEEPITPPAPPRPAALTPASAPLPAHILQLTTRWNTPSPNGTTTVQAKMHPAWQTVLPQYHSYPAI
jgi:hypothetical protein